MSGWNKFDVQLFAETSGILAGGKPSVCWMNETCGRVLGKESRHHMAMHIKL